MVMSDERSFESMPFHPCTGAIAFVVTGPLHVRVCTYAEVDREVRLAEPSMQNTQ
jgi:hypothetical protein